MPLALTQSLYRRTLNDQVIIRRYSGSPRVPMDYPCRAKVNGSSETVLIGTVAQYLYSAVVLAEDLVNGGFDLPVTTNDKMVYQGRELAIEFPDSATRTDGTEIIAINIHAKG